MVIPGFLDKPDQLFLEIADFKIAGGGYSCGILNLVTFPGLTFTISILKSLQINQNRNVEHVSVYELHSSVGGLSHSRDFFATI